MGPSARLPSADVPTASVVIPLYNGAATITEQLDALANQTATDFEVIVADNGSTDSGPDMVRAHSAGASLIDASARPGAGYARRVGTAFASSDKILYCDADDVADARWVEMLTAALDRWGLVGGRVNQSRLNPGIENWNGPDVRTMTAKPLPFAMSCNFAIRRTVLDALGGWHPDYPGAAGEDAELCWRAQRAGHTLGFEPEAVMYYRIRRNLRSHIRRHYQYGFWMVWARSLYPEYGPPAIPPTWRYLAWAAKNSPMLLRPSDIGFWFATAAFRAGTLRATSTFYPR